MARIYKQMVDLHTHGHDPRIFVDNSAALIYKCGICHRVSRNAVEITETENETNDHKYNTEASLFCNQCLIQSNLSNTYHPSNFIRNAINKLIVICPYSLQHHTTNNSEGDSNICQWEGELLNLDRHLNTECLKKPYPKCPFNCSQTQSQITRIHFNQNQTEHINILLSMVQSLSSQLTQCQNQILNLQQQINENKQIIPRRKRTPSNVSISDTPPPPPPLPRHKTVKININNHNPMNPLRMCSSPVPSSHFVQKPIDSVGSDFEFQRDHPNISVIANGRTALCTESKNILIEFGKCLLRNKPKHKSRNRDRNSSVDDFFRDPKTMNLRPKHSIIVLESDDECDYESKSKTKPKRRFSSPFKKHKKKSGHNRQNKTEIMDLGKETNVFSMSANVLNVSKSNKDKIKYWECFVFVEDCHTFGNVGIAIIKDTNDGISTLHKNGDYIDFDKSKTRKNGFGFEKGHMIKITVSWRGLQCFVSVLNTDTNQSVCIDKLDMFVKFGFILNQARITVIEQYWK